jgi:hypothetical protein
MKVQMTSTTTGKTVVVSWDGELFHARQKDAVGDAQVCLGVDLFEVVAELAELDLEREGQALEALELANAARTELLDADNDDHDDDFDDELSVDGVP